MKTRAIILTILPFSMQIGVTILSIMGDVVIASIIALL